MKVESCNVKELNCTAEFGVGLVDTQKRIFVVTHY